MSDTLTNALQQSAHSSTVLQGIMNPAVVNPLAGMGSAISAVSGMQGLQEKQAQQLAGQAYQGAINQETGEFDPNKFRTLLAQSGSGAAMAAGAALLNTQNISSDQLKQNLNKAQWVNSTSGALLKAGDFSDAAMLGALHSGVAGGILTLPEAQKQLADMPPDAAGRQRWLQVHRDTSGSYAEQIQQTYGTPGSEIDPSGRRVGTVQQPAWAGGAISAQPQAGVPLGLDPGQQAQYQQWLQGEVEIPDPNNPGGTQKATRIQMFQRMGVDPKLFYPGGGGGGSGGPPASPNVSPNAPPASPNVRTPPASPNASPNAGRPLSAPSVADIETQKAGAGMGIALTQRAGQVPDNQANLGNMLTDANKLDSMGAGSAREAYLNSFFQKWSGSGLLGNSTPQQIAAAESFNKIGNIMAANQMAALGASDARQQLSIGANPHLDLSKLGNEQIIHMLQGNEDAIAAKSRAWEDWKLTHGSGSYAQFQNDLNKNFDLRVFQQRYMSDGTNGTPDEIGAMKRQMKSQGTDEEFIRKILYARQHGWIQ